MAAFKTVAVAGKGQLGSFVVAELASSGFQVTILTRSKANLKDVPPGVNVSQVDYHSVANLTEVLKGQDVVIATLAMPAISVQHNLLEAAIQAGVRRYVPSEYSGNVLDPNFAKLPPVALLVDMQNRLKEAAAEGKISYTIFAPGGFLNMMLNPPVMLDWENHTAHLYDGGNSKLSVSRLSTIAKGIRAALQKGDMYANKIVKFHDALFTQRQALDIAKNERPDVQWTELQLDATQVVRDALKKVQEGNATPEVVGGMLMASSFSEKVHFGWTEEELENEKLGIAGLSEGEVEDLIRKRARGEWIDMPNEHNGDLRIDLK